MNAEQGLARRIAEEVLASFDAHRTIEPFTGRVTGFDLPLAYQVAAEVRRLRVARGEKAAGRKIGFTNTAIWAECNVTAPMWGDMYDTTIHDLESIGGKFRIAHLFEPKIEPEIVFGFAEAPKPGMTENEILGCVDWIAPGFEIVSSMFPGWKFQGADTVAALGVHGALLTGKKVPRGRLTDAEWLRQLVSMKINLFRNDVLEEQGEGANTLGSPLKSLRHLIAVLDRDRINPPLAAGEIVTTGTLTRLRVIQSGEIWSVAFTGIPFEGYSLHIE